MNKVGIEGGIDVPPQMPIIPHVGNGNNENLTNVELLALVKGSTREISDLINDSVPAGNYNIDFTLRVRGGIRKGNPQEQMVVAEIPWATIVYHLAQEVSPKALERSIGRALDEDHSKVKNFKSECEKIVTDLKGTTKRVIRGKVTTALTFTKV